MRRSTATRRNHAQRSALRRHALAIAMRLVGVVAIETAGHHDALQRAKRRSRVDHVRSDTVNLGVDGRERVLHVDSGICIRAEHGGDRVAKGRNANMLAAEVRLEE